MQPLPPKSRQLPRYAAALPAEDRPCRRGAATAGPAWPPSGASCCNDRRPVPGWRRRGNRGSARRRQRRLGGAGRQHLLRQRLARCWWSDQHPPALPQLLLAAPPRRPQSPGHWLRPLCLPRQPRGLDSRGMRRSPKAAASAATHRARRALSARRGHRREQLRDPPLPADWPRPADPAPGGDIHEERRGSARRAPGSLQSAAGCRSGGRAPQPKRRRRSAPAAPARPVRCHRRWAARVHPRRRGGGSRARCSGHRRQKSPAEAAPSSSRVQSSPKP
mmetsp:Transcript_11438/g.40661  ORF Transcript_11438/g.40661 Transcript_11438/m.40661 type:complete len:276 (+) Transcript_11438:545-1372(+)